VRRVFGAEASRPAALDPRRSEAEATLDARLK
jgi:hypothetical protein